MEYIKEVDYQYISNKYHDASQPFDGNRRFIRRDEIFAAETGLNAEAINEGILEQDKTTSHLPHTLRKAKAVAYVLKHTRISCDCRDRFPAIHMIDRPVNAALINTWKSEVFKEIIPETEKKRSAMEHMGIAALFPDFDHSVPVWERVFQLGFTGLLQASEEIRKAKKLTAEEDVFYEGIKITYTAVIEFVGRLAELAYHTNGSERMAEALNHIKNNPPANFYEALLVSYLYFMISEHIEGLQVRSLSNFDRVYYPFYRKDLAQGITEEELRTDLAYYFMQFAAIGNYWGQPVYLGGCKENEETQINELSYVFLDVYDKMHLYNPKIQIKLADSTPKKFVLKALDMIRRGHNSIVFVVDATIRQALMNSGVSKEEARLCDIKGCYEYAVQGALDSGMNYINLLKPLEFLFHEGCDGVTGTFWGRKSPAITEYPTFEAFLTEYKEQLRHVINMVIEIVNGYENYLAYINPQSLLSATYPACLERAKDALAGGATENGSVMNLGFLADISDSLAMIKKYVYDQKKISLSEMKKALDQNFEGYELLRRQLLADRDKYGNNKDLPDSIAKELVEFIVANVVGRENASMRQGQWSCGFHVARMSYTVGKLTLASPNGRLFGEELSKNCSASMGQNREGATAAILSVTKLDATSFAEDACLDLGLLPGAVQGEDGLEAMYGLIQTFAKRKGHAIHINVFDAKTLRDAQKYPERYQDLQIRVCGWNVLWNNINRKEQDGFIKQAESLVL